jgi:hypothetical protein
LLLNRIPDCGISARRKTPERAAGFAYNDTLQTKLDKLDALLAESFTSRQDAALLAEMLSTQRWSLPDVPTSLRSNDGRKRLKR